MNSPIQPLDGWVVVKPVEVEKEIRVGGVIINTLNENERTKRQNKGEVIAAPKECPVAVGAQVCYKSYAGIDVYLEGKLEKYLLIEFQDLCGVIT